MILTPEFGLAILNLVLAGLLVVGAVSLVALRLLLPDEGTWMHELMVRVALFLVAIVGLLSVLASIYATDDTRLLWRVLLGTLRGMALLAVWAPVVYDVTRHIDRGHAR